jgi:hypothetical protein
LVAGAVSAGGPLAPVARTQPPTITWVRAVSGPGDDYGWGIAVDRSNQVVATGHFVAPANLGATVFTRSGKEDILVAKFEGGGGLLWVRQAGAAEFDDGRGVATDPHGNVCLTGSFTGSAAFESERLDSAGGWDVFIAKYDRDGTLLWARRAGGADDDQGRAVAADGAGNVLVAGLFKGQLSFDHTNVVSLGAQDAFVAKVDPRGNLLWVRTAGGAGLDEASGVTADSAGNVQVTGSFHGTANFGDRVLTSHGGGDVFVAKYDPLGRLLWARHGGGDAPASGDAGYAIAVDEAGNAHVTGAFTSDARFDDRSLVHRGQGDVFVAKYDREGRLLWVRGFGDSGPDQGRGVGVDENGQVYVGGFYLERITFGTTTLLSPGHADAFVAQLGADGTLRWALQAGGSAYKAANALSVSPQGACFITGFYRGTTTFGRFTLTNDFPNNRDQFVARVDGPSAPRLRVTSAGRSVVLAWPTGASGYRLESAEDLSAGAAWLPVQQIPTVVNDRQTVSEAAAGQKRFYRLRVQ